MKNVGLATVRAYKILLPPLPEQRAIVKKLETLFSSLDAGVADLKKAQQQLKIYRQAVLKKAFEGELTKTNSDWITKRFEECTVSFNGKRVPLNRATREKRQGEFRYYGATEIVDYIDDYIFDGEFLLIGEDGANLLSKSKPLSFIVDGKFWVNNHAHIFKPNDNISIRYLNAYFNSLSLNEYVTGTAQPKLTKFNLCKIPVKLPLEISDQLLIVKEIESRLSVCDSIEQNIKESLVKAEGLRQSILKKAFEGNLLTAKELAECKQAADYEPASVLLERIKAEQNKATAKQSKKKVAQPLVVAKTETSVAKISADIHAGLIAKVIKIHEENAASIDKLSHIKCEKIAHLVEYHLQIPLGRQPVKDAAGPDDYPHLKKIEHRAKMANYFAIQKKEIGYSYSSAKNSDKAIEKFQSALSDEKNRQLNNLIALFIKFDLEVSEIIATTYAGWNNLILNGNANPSDEEIVYESRENWSERKLKIERERFFKAIEWMHKNEIVPTGYGTVVPFPKKQK
ncbi:hypothetical protein IO89_16135 [Epilithonimonas lactis]|uniref:Type I restriction modification DNA specificity domain-containing protein n=1 Tax=Epilithonimonas lactis TaxID=421072 RepID=A0A085B9A0_9FLAO|nr:hypothetical protein IO89_16135 [Epilithonimonas lactis]